jgi:triacylglycerol esterase/lipase EstA (alpha/beta hydrolase family)
MTDYHGVEGHSNLLRDPNNDSIVNIDVLGYEKYVAQREAKNKKNQKVQNIEQEVANMKEDINEIKHLLKELLNGSK